MAERISREEYAQQAKAQYRRAENLLKSYNQQVEINRDLKAQLAEARAERDRYKEVVIRDMQDAMSGFNSTRGHICDAKKKCEGIYQRCRTALEKGGSK